MKDGGVFLPAHDLPAHDGSEAGERIRLLRQIADVLGLPLAAFTRGPEPGPAVGPSSSECAAVLDAFSRIADPALRSRCLEMLERCATF